MLLVDLRSYDALWWWHHTNQV